VEAIDRSGERRRLLAQREIELHRKKPPTFDLDVLVGDTLDGGGIGAPSDGHNTFLREINLSSKRTGKL
jgi:hypothetical protein